MLKALLAGVVLIAVPLGLGGCGFTPVYAQKGLAAQLSGIDVLTTDSRTGYFLRQNLVSNLDSGDGQKLYRLNIVLSERRYEVGIGVDDRSSRTEISTTVTYNLVDIRTRKTLTASYFTDTTTYDATSQSPYAGVAAQKDAQQRAATAIAERIRSDLVLYFHNKASSAP